MMPATVEEMATLLARELLEKHGLGDWSFEWVDEMTEYAGMTYRSAKTIVVNRPMLLGTLARNIRETILHEIAHALTGEVPHTQDFLDKLKEIGGTATWVTTTGKVYRQKLEQENGEAYRGVED